MISTKSPLPALSESDLCYWVYMSNASHAFEESQILEILEASRENNARLSLTGMLLYKNGNFIQMLEGPMSVVKELSIKIERDPRHSGIVTLAYELESERLFPEHWMYFVSFERLPTELRSEVDSLLDMCPVYEKDKDKEVGIHPARLFMQTFAQHL